MCAWLGSKALGSGALARKVLIRRTLGRKVLARERGAGQTNAGRNWNRAWSRDLGSETLGMKPAGFGGAGNYPKASLGLRQQSARQVLSKQVDKQYFMFSSFNILSRNNTHPFLLSYIVSPFPLSRMSIWKEALGHLFKRKWRTRN